MKYNYFYSNICVLIFNLVVLSNGNELNLNAGARCRIQATNEQGVCTLFIHCPHAVDDVRRNRMLITTCSYDGYDQIVCCRPEIKPPTNLTKSAQKCSEYSKYVYSQINVTVGFHIRSIKIDQCGHKKIPLIVNGTPALLNEFPHSAILFEKNKKSIDSFCGGSLVSSRYVLTAAHCVSRYIASNILVRLRELVIDNDSDGANPIDVDVEQIIKHPSYKNSQKYNDIALLKLLHKIQLSAEIRPICLPETDDNPGKAVATGWGSTTFMGTKSKALLKVSLAIFSNTNCRKSFNNLESMALRSGIISSQICAGSETGKNDTCEGDSGGPLQIYHSNEYCMYTQVGITSFGISCGDTNFPGVYTRLYSFVNWIQNIIWAPGEDE